MNPLSDLLARAPFLLSDGALATELERAGFDTSGALWSARALADAPELLRRVHRSYLAAGADSITTAGYQASVPGFCGAGYSRAEAERLLRLAVRLAVEERDAWAAETGRRALVAASLGPYGAYLADGSEYSGRYGLSKEALVRFHRERLDVMADAGADLLAFETVPSLLEAEAAADALAGISLPAWISFSCSDEAHTSAGDPVEDCAAFLDGVDGVIAMGVNCMAPEWGAALLNRMKACTGKTLVIYPNSGESYDVAARCWRGEAADFGALLAGWLAAGARIVGGCCRTTPETIGRLYALRKAMAEGGAASPGEGE